MISSLSNRPWILYGNPALDPSGGGAFTSGSVIFAGAGGALTEDNPPFSYNPITNDLTAGVFTASLASFPRVRLVDTTQAADAKMFQIMNSGLTLRLKAVNDAETVAQPGIVLDRSGFITGAGQPACRLTKSGTQTLATGAVVAISFDVETFDVGGCHSGGSPTRLTVPTGGDGIYLINASIVYTSNVTGVRLGALLKNAATGLGSITQDTVFGDITCLQVTAIAQLVAGDYVEIFGYQTSGINLDVTTGCDFGWIKVW
jgi:hypothetical protein